MNIQLKLISCLRLLILMLLAITSGSHAQGLALRWQAVRSSVTDAAREQPDNKVARDASGNIFTAGGSNDGRTNDWVVRKLAAGTGAVLWERRLAIPNNELNVVAAITVDASGNPVVTGTSSTPGFSDYYTAKFSGATGAVVWEKRLSGPGSFWDEPADIDTDTSGNVIVTGVSYTSSFSADYLTVKYAAANGAVLWEKRHTASSSSDDRAYAVEVDASDNVLVAGSTGGRAGVIKYSAANGTVLWDRRHTVPGGSTSQALDLALDAAGNAFTTGSVGPSTGFQDFLTLRFAAATGNIDWDQRINGAAGQSDGGTDIAVDASGNVVVSGFTQPVANLASYDIRMAKYSGTNGTLLWGKTTTYSVESFETEPSRLALDAGGNVLLTGTTTNTAGRTALMTAKFATASGNLMWERTYVYEPVPSGFQIFQYGNAVITGSDSSVIVTGISNATQIDVDHFTIKYDSSGTQLWQNRYDGPLNRADWPGAVALDSTGDAIIAGVTLGATGFREFQLSKNDGATGIVEWNVRRARTNPTDHDIVAGVAADSSGNVILAGISDETSINDSIYLAKFASSNGAVLWERRFKPSAASSCRLASMALDPSGNILVTGMAIRSSSSGDVYTAKYNGANGALIWEQYLTSSSSKIDTGRGIAVDSAGNALVAGELTNLFNDLEMRVIKYSAAGVKLWERTPAEPEGRLAGIAVDPQGNPVVTGRVSQTGRPGLFTAKYAAATGAIVWEQAYDGTTAALAGEGVATDAAGNVFVTGYARSTRVQQDYDFITLKYDATTGTRLWENAYTGPFDEDRALGLVVDSGGNPVVTGLSEGSSAIFDLYTAKYSTVNGSLLGSHRQTASILEQDLRELQQLFTKYIAIGPLDRVIVCHLARPTLDDNDLVGLLYETPVPQIAIERLPAGTAVPAASTVDAGSIIGSPQISFRIRNTGTGALTFGSPEVVPGASGTFTVIPPATFSLQPGATTTFTIGMSEIPGGGQGSGTVSLTHNAPSASPFGFTLTYLSPSTDANLLSLAPDAGVIDPAFDPGSLNYWLTVPPERETIRFTPVASSGKAAITMNGQPVTSGSQGPAFNLATGTTAITTQVTAEDGVTVRRYTVSVTRLPEVFLLGASNVAPVTAAGFSATGHDIRFQLADPPQPGRTIKVVENTALPFIRGSFGNLQHGQEVILQHEGRSYAYVANYYGGSGNDLTLHWKITDLATWGDNEYGQLGHGDLADGLEPVRITEEGPLAGKTILAVSNGLFHCMALASDGTVAAWGDGFMGKLGYGGTLYRPFPTAVDTGGVLAGKTVVAIAAGIDHSLALCSDGTVAAWGDNSHGQLGDNRASGGSSSVPVAVNLTGALAGKQVVAIAAGQHNNLVLCSDGTLVTWGENSSGESGNGSSITTDNLVPVAVQQTGVLAGKQVVAISASRHCLALCSDGAIASWGFNEYGQLGNNSVTDSNIPVLVRVAGALVGRTPVAVVAGGIHSLALCSDGTAVGWGANNTGQVGDGTVVSPPSNRFTPVVVNSTGVLAGKTITRLDAGWSQSTATLSDGTLATWGWNADGQLGNNSTTTSPLPVAVSMAQLPAGSSFIAVAPGAQTRTSLAIVGLVPPTAITLAAGPLGSRSAVLHGTVSPNGSPTTVSFEFGETTAYGRTVTGIPATIDGSALETAVSGNAFFLRPAATYHFRIRAESAGGVAFGEDMTFTTPNDNAFAASLAVDAAALVPGFNKLVFEYSATLPFGTEQIVVDVGTEDPRATATVDGVAASGPVTVDLPVGTKAVEVIVTAEDRTTTRTYLLHVTRLPARFVYDTGSEVPVSSPRFVAPGIPVYFVLNYAPAPGTVLTVARSAGLEFISGRFSNLAQGQLVVLDHGGTSYRFTANYYGGSGNDLVLQWADTLLHGWGTNANGQLGTGDGSKAPWSVPAAIPAMTEPRLLATATGYLHSLALAADGTVLAWGYNVHGQLGDGSKQSRPDPAPVVPGGALAGKRVIAVAAGAFHSLALCDDGTVAAWGYNNHGQLGNGTTTTSTVPVAVERAGGVLAGKTVVSIAAGAYHSLALCSDGSVFAWGFNETGALGNNTTNNSSVPVSVRFQIGALQATGISAGQYHNLAIREGGSLVAWGYNPRGQLGTGDTLQKDRATPVPLPAGLAGKLPHSVAAGGSHSLVLFEDGTLAAWGLGTSGQLGDGAGSTRLSPVAVLTGPAFSGKSPACLAAGDVHSLVRFTDGSTAAWGGNGHGQLGTGSASSSPVPILIAGTSFMAAGTGSSSSHVLALQPLAASPGIATAAAGGTVPVTIDAWRMLHFGHPENSGEAADLHDPDHDGVPNLVEFAFGLDPRRADAGLLPSAALSDHHLVIEFTERPGLEGVIFKASSTGDLRNWTPVTDEGVKPQHRFRLPIGEGRGFMRLEVEER